MFTFLPSRRISSNLTQSKLISSKQCRKKSSSKPSLVLSNCLDLTSEKQSKGISPHNPISVEKFEEKPINYWVKDLALHIEDKDEISNGGWLSDKHISAMNKLLTAQFPAQEGLQDCLLLARYNKYQSGVSKFVQVINISREHWVCASNILSSPGVV